MAAALVFVGEGTTTPLDAWVDAVEATISLGVREMACRLNGDGKNFDKSAANMGRTAQVQVSGETIRVLVETEGKRVVRRRSRATCPSTGRRRLPAGIGRDARLFRQRRGDGSAGDGGGEKGRRENIKEKRRRRGRKAQPLPARRPERTRNTRNSRS